MKILENYCLTNNNTFKINVISNRFVEYETDEELFQFVRENKSVFESEFFIIGEGSNLLFTKDFDGTIIHPKTQYIKIQTENTESIFLEAAAGVIWDDFVEWTVTNKYFGLENLSLIPGTVGASAVQNIGAYGAEASNYIYGVNVLNLKTQKLEFISKEQCQFSYRNSIFKNELQKRIIVVSVVFELNKKMVLNLDYADIKANIENIEDVDASALRRVVIEIRNAKLPDPKIVGNAGSFFKNPIVSSEKFLEIKHKFPEVKSYKVDDNYVKIAAGWMIDFCGFKGFEYNGAAVHSKQALVIINKSNATGSSVLELSKIIQRKIHEVFDVILETEVIIL